MKRTSLTFVAASALVFVCCNCCGSAISGTDDGRDGTAADEGIEGSALTGNACRRQTAKERR